MTLDFNSYFNENFNINFIDALKSVVGGTDPQILKQFFNLPSPEAKFISVDEKSINFRCQPYVLEEYLNGEGGSNDVLDEFWKILNDDDYVIQLDESDDGSDMIKIDEYVSKDDSTREPFNYLSEWLGEPLKLEKGATGSGKIARLLSDFNMDGMRSIYFGFLMDIATDGARKKIQKTVMDVSPLSFKLDFKGDGSMLFSINHEALLDTIKQYGGYDGDNTAPTNYTEAIGVIGESFDYNMDITNDVQEYISKTA